jgi:uncharacterized protein YciI
MEAAMRPTSVLVPFHAMMLCLATASGVIEAQSPPAQTPAAPPAATTAAPMRAAPLYLIVYKAGPAWKADAPSNDRLRDHGRYMFGLYQKKALRMGGPFTDITGGAALIEAASLADAQAVVDADPAVTSKLFVAEVHSWSHVDWDELAKRLMPPPPSKP